ncbi:MAG TPA: outer membrane lipoprotein carrier protein LolA [Gemmatimonadaceae bacterium]|nr:outer membrane lipoprotein carrier protein LolA [Gemmatimonadaceae bacterium]
MLRSFAVLVLLSAVGGGAGAQSSADAPLERAVAAYRNVRTLRATFDQTLTNPVTSRSSVAKGELLVKRPGKVAVRFSEPAGDRIVSDGSRVWIYLPSSAPGQVIRSRVDTQGMGLDVSTELLTAPRTRFAVTDGGAAMVGERATHVVTLVPKTPRNYTRARLWVDDRDGLVRQLELTEQSGVTRLVLFRTLQLNATIPASAFKFAVPKGVKVYDGE